jgi:hypothetical protein
MKKGALPDASRRSPAIRTSPRSSSWTTSPPTAPPQPASAARPCWPAGRCRRVGAGKACALNQLRAARGDLVLFLDAKTLPRPELARALAAELNNLILSSAGQRFRPAWPKSPACS